jgi:hypothetical protein
MFLYYFNIFSNKFFLKKNYNYTLKYLYKKNIHEDLEICYLSIHQELEMISKFHLMY